MADHSVNPVNFVRGKGFFWIIVLWWGMIVPLELFVVIVVCGTKPFCGETLCEEHVVLDIFVQLFLWSS